MNDAQLVAAVLPVSVVVMLISFAPGGNFLLITLIVFTVLFAIWRLALSCPWFDNFPPIK